MANNSALIHFAQQTAPEDLKRAFINVLVHEGEGLSDEQREILVDVVRRANGTVSVVQKGRRRKSYKGMHR